MTGAGATPGGTAAAGAGVIVGLVGASSPPAPALDFGAKLPTASGTTAALGTSSPADEAAGCGMAEEVPGSAGATATAFGTSSPPVEAAGFGFGVVLLGMNAEFGTSSPSLEADGSGAVRESAF